MASHLTSPARNRDKGRRWLVAFMASLGSAALAASCGNTSEVSRCATGASVPCACMNGDEGTQSCLEDGTFEPCSCGAAQPSGLGGVSGAGSFDGAGTGGAAPDAGAAGQAQRPLAGEGGRLNSEGGQSSAGKGLGGDPLGHAGASEAGAGSQAGVGSTCERKEPEGCDGLDNDCDGAIDDGEVCPDDTVHHVEPFLDGVYMVGTLRPGVSDNDVLLRVWPSVAPTYRREFNTYLTAFNFRRTDGALFYTAVFSGLHEDKPGNQDPLLLTPPCWEDIRSGPGNPGFGFDGAGVVYYMCDETVRRGNGVKVAALDWRGELVAVLADGRFIITAPSLSGETWDFVALAADGTELGRLDPRTDMEGTLAPLPGSASVAGDQAYLAFSRSYGVEQNKEIVVYRLNAVSVWQRVRRLSVADFGGWTLAASDGTVFTRDYDAAGSVIHAYLPNIGVPVTAWREGDQSEVHTGSAQLLVGPP